MSAIEILSGLPLDVITPELLTQFCELQVEEGLDLDYKRDWPNDLAQVICAFANTQGGTIFIGIEEEGKTRKPKCPPVGVVGDGEEAVARIRNICFDAIYPPVIPEIGYCRIKNAEGRDAYVLIIRVFPTRQLHATDRRSRINIRVADSKRGYELASLSDLEWLWNRREELLEQREKDLERAFNHAESKEIRWHTREDMILWAESPKLVWIAQPVVPTPGVQATSREILESLNNLGETNSTLSASGRSIPYHLGTWRSIANGVMLNSRGQGKFQQFVEITSAGTIFCQTILTLEHDQNGPPHINPYGLLADLSMFMPFTQRVCQAMRWSAPISIQYSLSNTEGQRILFNARGLIEDRYSSPSPDERIELIDIEMKPAELEHNNDLMLTALTNLFWAFGIGWNTDDITGWYQRLLRNN